MTSAIHPNANASAVPNWTADPPTPPTPLCNSDPADVDATTPSPGVAADASRCDHVHAHGDLSGGSLHDLVTPNPGGVAGFMSPADKAILDDLPGNVGPAILGPLSYLFDTGTGAGPAAGDLRLNNAAPAAATSIFVSETDKNADSVTALLQQLEIGDRLLLVSSADSSIWALYQISGDPVDNGTDWTIPVSNLAANGALANNGPCILLHQKLGELGVAVSQTAADTLTASVVGATTEALFSNQVTVPANTLIAGSLHKLWVFISVTTSAAAPNFRFRIRKDNLAGTLLCDTGSQNPGNNFTGQPGLMPFLLLGTAAAGAAAPVHTHHVGRSNHNLEGSTGAVAQPVNVVTNAALLLRVTIEFAAATAGNSCTVDGLFIERVAA